MLSLPEPLPEIAWYFAVRDFDAALDRYLDARPGTHDRAEAYQAGRATTLFSNTATAGSLLAGIVAGATAQALGYGAALLLCGMFSAVAHAYFSSGRSVAP